MTDTPRPDEASNLFESSIPSTSDDTPDLGQCLDDFSIALKALQMAMETGIAAANGLATNATADEVRQGWLASLMPLRYTMHHLQFRSSSLIQAIGDALE